MSGAYYNEIEAYPAQWLRNLSEAGHIARGDVDERDIRDVTPADLRGYRQCHFFAGIGVWSYALRLAGVPDDASVWTGSCPCQPFSQAGRREGADDARHLWPDWFRLIRECRPAIILGEQVTSRDGLDWIAAVFADLESLGYACGAADLPAAGVGAPHIRQRLFWVAYANEQGRTSVAASWVHDNRTSRHDAHRRNTYPPPLGDAKAWREVAERGGCQPGILGLAPWPSELLERLRAYGNAIVPQVAAMFIQAALQEMPRV